MSRLLRDCVLLSLGFAFICLLPTIVNGIIDSSANYDELLMQNKVAFAAATFSCAGWLLAKWAWSREQLTVFLGGVVLILVTQDIMTRLVTSPFDFRAYERAGYALVNDGDVYKKQAGGFIYPPLLAQAFSLALPPLDELERDADKAAAAEAKEDGRKKIRRQRDRAPPILSLWCALSALAALGTYLGGVRLAKRCGADTTLAVGLSLGLLLANAAYWKTIVNGQVNLFLVLSVFVAILAAKRHPVISGFSLALGGHLKVYPALLLGPWAAAGYFRIAASALFFFASIFALQVGFSGIGLWEDYLQFAGAVPQQVRPHSLATVGIVSFLLGDGKAVDLKGEWGVAAWVTAVMYGLILLTMGTRFLWRELLWRRDRAGLDQQARAAMEDRFRLTGHGCDAAALPLLISPIVWHHHYLILIPGLIWACVVLGVKQWKHWLPIAILIFPYTVAPYIYIYYIAIWLWLYQTTPPRMWTALIDRGPSRIESERIDDEGISGAPLVTKSQQEPSPI